MKKYRHRAIQGVTRFSLRSMQRHLYKIGRIRYIKGYRYQGKYRKNEAVLVVGTKGSIRLGGFLWGYSGEGPRGTHKLLLECGVNELLANKIAYHTPRLDEVGEDWRLSLELNWIVETPTKELAA